MSWILTYFSQLTGYLFCSIGPAVILYCYLKMIKKSMRNASSVGPFYITFFKVSSDIATLLCSKVEYANSSDSTTSSFRYDSFSLKAGHDLLKSLVSWASQHHLPKLYDSKHNFFLGFVNRVFKHT